MLRPLGPFGRPPRLGLAVSGGGDSLAMAVLAAEWSATEGGTAFAFIVDHGLRAESGREAAETAEKLRKLRIPAKVLTLEGLEPGPALPARARAARLGALEAACLGAGIIDLLLAHHAADQAETVIMRQLRGSGPSGLAGMAAIVESERTRLLRPLLGVPPGRLRATLRARGLSWAEDPTNADTRFTRARLRAARGDAAGMGAATRALCEAAAAAGLMRQERDRATAAWLARAAVVRPQGFALLPDAPWPAQALAALLRMIAGADHMPAAETILGIAASPGRAIGGGLSLAGALLRPAGRLSPGGILLCREAAAMGGPVPATPGAIWDGRFRRPAYLPDLPGEMISALGAEVPRMRSVSDLPAVVLRTLPAYYSTDGRLIAVPALSWPDRPSSGGRRLMLHPPHPAAGAAFGMAFGPARAIFHDGSVSPT